MFPGFARVIQKCSQDPHTPGIGKGGYSENLIETVSFKVLSQTEVNILPLKGKNFAVKGSLGQFVRVGGLFSLLNFSCWLEISSPCQKIVTFIDQQKGLTKIKISNYHCDGKKVKLKISKVKVPEFI